MASRSLGKILSEAVQRVRSALIPRADAGWDVPRPAPGEAPAPPWITYPDTDPSWGGWRQGVSEAWLNEVWLPFWRSSSAAERGEYLARWPPPNDAWRDHPLWQ